MPRRTSIEKAIVALVVILSVSVLVLSVLAPGFSLDNGLVYGGF
jgi:hypothetical protein